MLKNMQITYQTELINRPAVEVLAITISFQETGNKFQILKRNFPLLMKDLWSPREKTEVKKNI